jgi:hypothetical protein
MNALFKLVDIQSNVIDSTLDEFCSFVDNEPFDNMITVVCLIINLSSKTEIYSIL